MIKKAVIAGISIAALAATALAQRTMDHSKMGHGTMPSAAVAAMTPAAKAFAEVNAKMHKDMTLTFTGDADVDFFEGMIPHHQGAIDMANVVLKYGKSPETRKLAVEIIKAQETEIAFMKDWLAKNEKK